MIVYYTQTAGFKELTGLSSDTKPTPTVGETWIFYETDTSKSFYYNSGWVSSSDATYEVNAKRGVANGYAPLGADSKVPLANLPSIGVGDVVGPVLAGADKVVLFDGITGKLIKDSGLTLAGINTGDQTLPTDATIATTDITTNNATTAKHGWMPKGTGSTATFFRSDMTQAAPTASVAITEAEIDVGTTPVSEATITVTDTGITTNSRIIGGLAYIAPTGKDLDELEMDALDILFQPATGSMNVIIRGLDGYIADKFKIWYTYA